MTTTNLTLNDEQSSIVKSALVDKVGLFRRYRSRMANDAQGVDFIDSQIETLADLINQLSDSNQ